MSFDCNCPKATSLTVIPANDCPFRIDQVQRLMFVRGGQVVFDLVTPANSVPVVAGDPTLVAGWNALRALTDDTTVVVTPLIGADPVLTPGEAITIGGGDNSTLNGVAIVTGKGPSSFAGTFTDITPAQETAMQALGCEDLEVYFVTRDQKIWAVQLAADKFQGVPVTSVFVGDRGSEGFGTRNTNAISFNLNPGWSNDLINVIPTDFNPLTF